MSYTTEKGFHNEINKYRAEVDRCHVLLQSCKEVVRYYDKRNWILKAIDRRLDAFDNGKEDTEEIRKYT